MKSLLQRLMGDAARLTRSGDLHAATAAIQSALARAGLMAPRSAVPAGERDVIDVSVRESTGPAALVSSVAPAAPVTEPIAPARPTARPGAGRFVSGSHTESSGTRGYKLFLPPNPGGQAMPLIVMLHGCTQGPDDFAAGTAMNELAVEQGFAVLYPEQSESMNPQRCWNWFKHSHQQRGRGEPAVIAGMTQAVLKEHGLDARRVYVAGLSAGGAMAAILGDTYPDIYAAVGVHSGLATGSATDVQGAFAAMKGGAGGGGLPGMGELPDIPGLSDLVNRPARAPRAIRTGAAPPTIVFHGDNDSTVHPVNGEQVIAAAVGSLAMQDGAGAAAIEKERGRSAGGRSYTRQLHRGAGGVVSEHWIVHGSGHAWSGGRTHGSYTDPLGPDATREMARFFLTHRLPMAH